MDRQPIVLNHPIDPTDDVVFRAILGDRQHSHILVDFLNAVLRPAVPIVVVDIDDPRVRPEHASAKGVVLDIKARDANGVRFDVEVQVQGHPFLAERVLYYWACVYKEQIATGESYAALRPAVAIWLMVDPIYPDGEAHYRFEVVDQGLGQRLTAHLAIHVLQPSRWRGDAASVVTAEDAWLYYFRDAPSWTQLPDQLSEIASLRDVMSIVRAFSDQESEYFAHLRRLDQRRVQATIEESRREIELALEEARSALATKEAALATKDAALADSAAALATKEAALAMKDAAPRRWRVSWPRSVPESPRKPKGAVRFAVRRSERYVPPLWIPAHSSFSRRST